MNNQSISQKITVLGLFSVLLVMTTACGGENSSDTNSSVINQTTKVENGKVEISCSSSGSGNSTATSIVNGEEYRCVNGKTFKVK